MQLKLIMTWDISPNREQDYFEFVIREFIPGIQRMGLDLIEAWVTVYGSAPQIQVGAMLPARSSPKQIMRSDEWKSLNSQLLDYVTNYNVKVVEAHGGFQM